jgi:hypothetical protein
MPPWLAAAALVAAHAGGRCAGVLLINAVPYVADRVGKIVQSDDPLLATRSARLRVRDPRLCAAARDGMARRRDRRARRRSW